MAKVLRELQTNLTKSNQHLLIRPQFCILATKYLSIQQHCKSHLFWKTKTKSNSRWRFWILIGWQSFPIDTLKPKNMKLWSSSTNVDLICNSEFISPKNGNTYKQYLSVMRKSAAPWNYNLFFKSRLRSVSKKKYQNLDENIIKQKVVRFGSNFLIFWIRYLEKICNGFN